MSHLTEEELILHYYGEEDGNPAAGRHLEECEGCRALYGSLQRVLNVVDAMPVPERGADYGAAVRRRLEPHLPAPRRGVSLLGWWRTSRLLRVTAAAAGLACLLAAAFVAGRFYPPRGAGRQPLETAAESRTGERVLLLAVGDYLERSQMVLVELANARPAGPLDISAERERAADLVSESRLYRQSAAHAGEAEVASVLDDLDRVMLEISHSPDRVTPEELEALRGRFEAEGILFKIRVLGSNVRNRENAEPANARPGGQRL